MDPDKYIKAIVAALRKKEVSLAVEGVKHLEGILLTGGPMPSRESLRSLIFALLNVLMDEKVRQELRT